MNDTELLQDDFLLDDELFAEEAATAELPSPKRDLTFLKQLPVNISLEVASAEVSLGEISEMGEGHVITLDRMVGEPLDVRVNGALLGRGEVVEVNGRYGVRLLEVEAPQLSGVDQ